MSGLIVSPAEFAHPMKASSADEMHARGMCDITDPEARLPGHCSFCGRKDPRNPLKLIPVDPRPEALARSYLYRSVCAGGCRHA